MKSTQRIIKRISYDLTSKLFLCNCFISYYILQRFKMFVYKSQNHPKLLCSTHQVTGLLCVCVCVCVYEAVTRGRVMSVSLLSLFADPVTVNATSVSQSEQCCLHTHVGLFSKLPPPRRLHVHVEDQPY